MAFLKPWQTSIIRWVVYLALVVALLILFAFTPFYAKSVLWVLNKVPVTVNQVAAASQQNSNMLVIDDAPVVQSMAGDNSSQPLVDQASESSSHHLAVQPNPHSGAHVIVVLGGGLGRDAARNIVVNQYTRLRLEQAVSQAQQHPLPILLSGVEAPYMQSWLAEHQVSAHLLEDRSMNTCENTRFSALLLQTKGGASRVELVTDAYHMPRARRLFALNGIDTIPVIAPLPNRLTAWQPDSRNLMHSRRATYEAIATLRDLWVGETNCREVP